MNPIRIAIDVMGGDFAPLNEIKGAILASNIFRGNSVPVEFVFVGKEHIIKETLKNLDTKGMNFSVVHAEDIVSMDDDPTSVLKRKKTIFFV